MFRVHLSLTEQVFFLRSQDKEFNVVFCLALCLNPSLLAYASADASGD